MTGSQQKPPFVPSLLLEFHKCLTSEILVEINEMVVDFNRPDEDHNDDGQMCQSRDDTGKEQEKSDASAKKGTLMLNATCALQNIAFPQDINFLNEARQCLQEMLDTICYEYSEMKPHTYRQNARRDYLALAKRKKCGGKLIRQTIRKPLQYVRRDLGYIDRYLQEGRELPYVQEKRLAVIRKVYEQQKYMYDNRGHSVADRIVSISQPYIRSAVRGKAKVSIEFGVKLDMSLGEHGIARIEKQSFNS